MLSSLHQRIQPEQGFTLTELLVVMIILAILMAIAVPSYIGRRIAAQDNVAQTDASSMLRYVETCATEFGQYVDEDTSDVVYRCDDRPGIGTAYSRQPYIPESDPAYDPDWFLKLTHLRYGWAPGMVEVDPCQENQATDNPLADASWSCAVNVEGFFVIARSHSGGFFYLRKIIGTTDGLERHCTPAGVGGCSGAGTW